MRSICSFQRVSKLTLGMPSSSSSRAFAARGWTVSSPLFPCLRVSPCMSFRRCSNSLVSATNLPGLSCMNRPYSFIWSMSSCMVSTFSSSTCSFPSTSNHDSLASMLSESWFLSATLVMRKLSPLGHSTVTSLRSTMGYASIKNSKQTSGVPSNQALSEGLFSRKTSTCSINPASFFFSFLRSRMPYTRLLSSSKPKILVSPLPAMQ